MYPSVVSLECDIGYRLADDNRTTMNVTCGVDPSDITLGIWNIEVSDIECTGMKIYMLFCLIFFVIEKNCLLQQSLGRGLAMPLVHQALDSEPHRLRIHRS